MSLKKLSEGSGLLDFLESLNLGRSKKIRQPKAMLRAADDLAIFNSEGNPEKPFQRYLCSYAALI